MPDSLDKKRIHPDEAVRILRENGLEISPQEAALLLDFLYRFAVFSIEYITRHKNESS